MAWPPLGLCMQAYASQARWQSRSGGGGEVSSGRGCRTSQGRSFEMSSGFGLPGASTRSVDVFRTVRCSSGEAR
jgi:hypothetical protein